jgi:protein-S-isoprenylcysteine O-methyltransferase Ste14
MRLTDHFHLQGAFLFRWRGLVPLMILLPIAAALKASGQFDRLFGETAEEVWDVTCVTLAFAGLAVRAAAVACAPAGTSGRNTRDQRAEMLNTTGLYSVVRHPLYLGNCIIYIAVILSVKVWWLLLVVIPLLALYYERIMMAEEVYLDRRFCDVYRAWAARTPALIPDLSRWTPPSLPFSWRNVLRREYNGFYGIVFAMTVVEFATDVIGEGVSPATWLTTDRGWIAFFLVGTVLWIALRTIKKRTGWLRDVGR